MDNEKQSLDGKPVENYAYPPELDEEHVYEALLGYGMFPNKLPPCFSSTSLFEFTLGKQPSLKSHATISYMASRHTNTSRRFAIPHPESYVALCNSIKNNWEDINRHLGQPKRKFSICHVRRMEDKKRLFEMSYNDKMKEEEIEQQYYLGCSHVVKTDISSCFPSIYTHSIPQAIQGKEKAKTNRCTTEKKQNAHWSNDIDRDIRNCNDQQTNGLLIGPHTSNIISEIVLTKVDSCLRANKFEKIIRHVDDYTYFASDENDARTFLKQLELCLRDYDLLLNQKKTSIVPLTEYLSATWKQKLARFYLPDKEQEALEFMPINAYLNFAISLAISTKDFAVINYAIKVISKKCLTHRAKIPYVQKILALLLLHPYLLPLLETHVFGFVDSFDIVLPIFDLLPTFLDLLFNKALDTGTTDALSFCFYYAIKYEVTINNLSEKWEQAVLELLELNDCISILLASKYAKKRGLELSNFRNRFEKICKLGKREQDRFWIFLYEFADSAEEIPEEQEYLRMLKESNVSFLDFSL